VIVAEQVQEPVREVPVQLEAHGPALGARASGRGVEGHYHVAQERPTPGGLGEREREHVGRAIDPPPGAVQRADAPVGDERDRELVVRTAERFQVSLPACAEAARRRPAPGVDARDPDGHGFATSCTGGRGASPGYSGRVW
jgi:hypothetical protein